jgi:hypothetical protein
MTGHRIGDMPPATAQIQRVDWLCLRGDGGDADQVLALCMGGAGDVIAGGGAELLLDQGVVVVVMVFLLRRPDAGEFRLLQWT